jgi:hypothetical protein
MEEAMDPRESHKFKGFQRDLDMVPLGPLKTMPASAEVTDHYRTIVDRYDKTVYRNMIVGVLEGVAPYNRYINHTPPYKWVIHPNWYTTAGYRAKNNGMLGRSLGCITVDPAKTTRSSRAFREHDLRDGRRCPYRTIFVIAEQNQCGLRDENIPAAFKPATVMIEPTIKTSPADR